VVGLFGEERLEIQAGQPGRVSYFGPKRVFAVEKRKEYRMSSPNEIRVLRTVKELGNPTKRAVAKAMDISEDYAGYYLRVLADRGSLEKVSGSFYITGKGIDELLAALYHVQGQLQAKMYKAEQQEKRVGRRIEELRGSKASV